VKPAALRPGGKRSTALKNDRFKKHAHQSGIKLGIERNWHEIMPPLGVSMDSGTIFVLVLALLFFAGIVYLGVLSRRNRQMELRRNVTSITPEVSPEHDTHRRRPAA
jgi:hypothetical protein